MYKLQLKEKCNKYLKKIGKLQKGGVLLETDLTHHLSEASLGYEYNFLKSIVPNWATDLHTRGNELSPENIETITKYGLVNWYVHSIIFASLKCDLDINIDIKTFFTDIDQFYKFNKLSCYYNCFKTEVNFDDVPSSLKGLFLKQRCGVNPVLTGFRTNANINTPFKTLLHQYDPNISESSKNIITKISEYLGPYIEHGCIFDTFYMNVPTVFNELTIIFSRLKIILEKMGNVANEDIYKFDKMCTIVQSAIYNCIYTYFINFPTTPIQKSSNEEIIAFLTKNNINYEKIKKIVQPIETNKIPLLKYIDYA